MQSKLVVALTQVAILIAMVTVVRNPPRIDKPDVGPSSAEHEAEQAVLRARFREIPGRLARELFQPPSSSRIVGLRLSHSQSDSNVFPQPDGPVDTVSVKPLEDIGCGCCTFPVICESFDRDEFQLIASLAGLKTVAVSSTHITDECPLMLRSQTQLESLDLSNNPLLTDNVIASIKQLRNLRSLDLSDTAVTGRGLAQLAKLPHLKRLVLAGTRITDAALNELGQLQQLEELDLSRTRIQGFGFARMGSLRNLEKLRLVEADVTSQGLSHLYRMPALRHLDLRGSQLTNERIDVLGACTQLEEIDFNSTAIGDRTLMSLRPLTNLQRLRAYASAITDEGLKSLRGMRQLELLDMTHSRVLGHGLQYLANCAKLQQLHTGHPDGTPILVDAETAQVLNSLSELHRLDIELVANSAGEVPSLRLGQLARLRRLVITCPSHTGSIELTDLPALTELTIRGRLRPADGYYGANRPLPRPLPQIASIRLTRIGPDQVRLQSDGLGPLTRSVLTMSLVVPQDLVVTEISNLSQLRLTGRIVEATQQAFRQTPLRTLLSMDCAADTSPESALALLDQFFGQSFPEDGGYGPELRLRIPKWTDSWSHALAQTQSNIKRLRLETRTFVESAALNLGGLQQLERIALAETQSSLVHVTNLAPSTEAFSLERCALGLLVIENGFAPLRCRELTRFEKLIVISPNRPGPWLSLFRTGTNDPHPNDPHVYAPADVELKDIGNARIISLDYGVGIRNVAIDGPIADLEQILYIPRSTQTLSYNRQPWPHEWEAGGDWHRKHSR